MYLHIKREIFFTIPQNLLNLLELCIYQPSGYAINSTIDTRKTNPLIAMFKLYEQPFFIQSEFPRV